MEKIVSPHTRTGIILGWVSFAYTAIMISIFPLYSHNNYYDTTVAKWNFFRILTICFLLCSFLFIVASVIERLIKKQRLFSSGRKQPDYVLVWAAAFLIVICISALMSQYWQEAFLGLSGRRTCALFWLLAVLSFVVIGRYLKVSMSIVWIFLIGNLLVLGLAVLNFWGLDPLSMYNGLSENQRAAYLSTMGNVNMSVCYDCLIYPIGLALFFLSRERLSKLLYGIFLVIGCWGLLSTVSEGWIFGIAGAFAILLWFALRSPEDLKSYCQTAILFLGSMLALKYAVRLALHLGKTSTSLLKFQWQEQNVILLSPAFLWVLLSIFAAILFWSVRQSVNRGKDKEREICKTLMRIRKILFLILAAVIVVGVLALTLFTINPALAGGNALLQQFSIADGFGSGRGFVWRNTLNAWAELPVSQKLFGHGPNCFKYLLNTGEVQQFFQGLNLADAHNEFLDMLTNTGILGVIGYFGLILIYLVRCSKGASEFPILIVGIAALGSYLLQGLVNSPQPFSTPLLFVFLGVLEALIRKKNTPAERNKIPVSKQEAPRKHAARKRKSHK